MSSWLRQFAIILFLGASLRPLQAAPGANVPWLTYEAEDMTNNGGTLIGPPAQVVDINAGVSNSIEMEASGGQAIKLTGAGQYVEFTARSNANGLVLRYCVPDTANGTGTNYTISLYTNGIFVQKLPVTSVYSWRYGSYSNGTPAFSNNPGDGTPRNFFDEVRLNGLAINAGDTVRIEEDADDTAAFYILDLIDLENVAGPLTAPPGSLSIIDPPYNAVGDGVTDCSTALQNCILDASSGGKTVWIPAGTYVISKFIGFPSNTTIQGAGMWYTTLLGNASVYNTTPNKRIGLDGVGSNIHLSDFAVVGRLNYRNDAEPNDGLVGAYGTGSTISRIWVEHTKTGAWITSSSGLVVSDCRFRDTEADGINLQQGMRGCIITNCTARGTGDDCFAFWPASGGSFTPGLNVITHCTGQLPFLANGGAIYGAINNRIEDCAFSDIPYGCGLLIAGEFPVGNNNFAGQTVAQRCDLNRCGGYDPGWHWRGALTIVPDSLTITNLNINHLNITKSLSYAVQVIYSSPGALSNSVMNVVNISNYGVLVGGVYGVWSGIWNSKYAVGSLNVGALTVNGSAITSMPASGTDVGDQSLNFFFNFIPAPAIAPTLLGDVLQLSWPASSIGWTLQAQTNAPGVGMGTNWGIVSGSPNTNQFFIPMDNITGSMFFRLIDL